MLLIKLGLRNILRNKRRTILAALAISLGLTSLILTDGIMIGMSQSLVRLVTSSFLGHAQINAKNYRDAFEVDKSINNLAATTASLNNEKTIQSFALRTQTLAMLSSASNVSNIVLFGIQKEKEMGISMIKQSLLQGSLENLSDQGVIIGDQLAQKMEIGLGEKLIVTVAQVGTGELSQEMFKVEGIFSFNAKEMDRGIAFISLSSSQRLLNINNRVHSIILKFKNILDSSNLKSPFWKKYSAGGNEALSWRQISPGIDSMIEMGKYSTAIIAAILFLIVVLGIMNTIFMSLHERTFEFGVMRAIGSRPGKIILLILTETSLLGIFSIVIGVIFSLFSGKLLSMYGLDYTGIELGGVTMQEPLYFVYETSQFIIYPICIYFFTLISGIYPSIHAAKITLVDAMKKSL
ncbi:MAG: ABC transporter permease [Bacteriovoracaceae bacterium]|nr:ABC transporter permease [Bacteriovoracaceae bacterium]